MSPLKKQRGLATLAISIILLILITLASLYLGRTLIQEKTLVGNDIRAKQAFEAAEAGIAVAQEYFVKGIAENTADGKYEIFASVAGEPDDSFRGTLGDNRFEVTLEEVEIDGIIAMAITSTGISSDGSARKTVHSDIVALNPLPNIPDNPISTKGAFIIGGSATVTNTEGHSTIWSGEDVDVGSNNSTKTEVANPNDDGYPACMDIPNACSTMQSSNREMAGLDIIEHDTDLANLTAEEMFINFFGIAPSSYKETMATRVIDPLNPSESRGDCGNSWDGCAHLAQNEVVWVEGDLVAQGKTVGCAVAVTGSNSCAEADEAPSIVIVNGDAEFSGTPHFYGILFIMGNLNGTGNMTVHGAMISAGQGHTGSGSLDAYYNSRLLEKLQSNGPRAVSAGSWKDF
ncbi:PilX N-terminal domain-containing pilus assembly protein [Thalassotalea ponticola]|uniref:PilX N-terminal domain-containing pilus assembly protein n=1 Tax=Thalassotalea ponticola TaxID=1523392 RepID=UPI0025B38611|nr:PilX N-terminal domain-containing pilus assembly protein [Thalassotalea ponticola]MDN3651699.1 PilX N-terminal domain-containing pilus assembly protein [Thalassotalea ponticola]